MTQESCAYYVCCFKCSNHFRSALDDGRGNTQFIYWIVQGIVAEYSFNVYELIPMSVLTN